MKIKMDKIKRLKAKSLELNSPDLWVSVTISQDEIQLGIDMGTLQESESARLGLNDRSFSGDEGDSLARSIAAKQSELAVVRWGGGTAKVIGINQFHDEPDVISVNGGVNVRYTADPGYGLVLTNRDQNLIPMILITGKCPDFKIMGWIIPAFAVQFLYKVHSGRCEDCQSEYGFLQRMKEHERCHINMQSLFPPWSFNKNLII
jgi:hypothetical protein